MWKDNWRQQNNEIRDIKILSEKHIATHAYAKLLFVKLDVGAAEALQETINESADIYGEVLITNKIVYSFLTSELSISWFWLTLARLCLWYLFDHNLANTAA